MKRMLLVLLLLPLFGFTPAAPTLQFGPFGNVHLYKETARPERVVLFFSGDGGWNLGVIGMARSLAKHGALVVGIDTPRYLKNLKAAKSSCAYPPTDLQNLAQYVQKKLGYPTYHVPTLAGYSSGATLVYTSLVQAPIGTFQGGVSLGFCSDLEFTKPLCPGRGLKGRALPKGKGYDYEPYERMQAPWRVLHGTDDKVCSTAATVKFMQKADGRLLTLPKVGHGFSVERNWVPQLVKAYDEVASVPTYFEANAGAKTGAKQDVDDLPIVETTAPAGKDTLAVIVTGDGGWADFDVQLAERLKAAGIPSVGLDSLRYFWTARTPDSAAKDVARLTKHYLDAWQKKRVMLIGYSFGADVLPFIVERLPPDLRQQIETVALLSPSQRAQFEFTVGDWIGGNSDGLDVVGAVHKLKTPRILCFSGKDDEDAACAKLQNPVVTVSLPAGHRLNDVVGDIAKILQQDAK